MHQKNEYGSTSICTRTELCSFHAAGPRGQECADIDAAIGAHQEAVAIHAADDAERRGRWAPKIEAFDVRGFFAERFGGVGGDAFRRARRR
jgi:hypothetical protein